MSDEPQAKRARTVQDDLLSVEDADALLRGGSTDT